MKHAKIMMLALMLGSVFALSACNTVEGAGRDIESAGSAVKNSAADANDGKPN